MGRRVRLLALGLTLGLALGTATGVLAQAGGPLTAQLQQLLNTANTWAGVQTFTNGIVVSGSCTGCGGGGGGIGGSIADGQIAFGVGTDIGGSADLTWDGTGIRVKHDGAFLRISSLFDAETASSVLYLDVHSDEMNAASFSIGLDGNAGNPTPNTIFTFPGLASFTGASAYSFDGPIATGMLTFDSNNISSSNSLDLSTVDDLTLDSLEINLGRDGAEVAFTNGRLTFYENGFISTSTNNTNVLTIQAWDGDDAAFRAFAVLTSADTPSFVLAPPAGGALNIQASEYKSSDGTVGVTGTCAGFPTVKNGLIVSCTGI